MYKKIIFIVSICFLMATEMFSSVITEENCKNKGADFIYIGGECIEYYKADGEAHGILNIIVHGSWPDGTNTLGRYTPFADNIAMATDVTTIAVALPGYSKSSTNNLKALIKGGKKPLGATKEYLKFMEELVTVFKNKYNANIVTYIGHSAGAMMGATLSGINPNLIQNIALAGGRYDVREISKDKSLISAVDVINGINKKMKIVLVYGTKDTISTPKVTLDFYNLLKNKGFSPKIVEIKDGEHVDLDMSDGSVKEIVEMIESAKDKK